jgi:hypothetical protein
MMRVRSGTEEWFTKFFGNLVKVSKKEALREMPKM